jgi:hypothetical protein
MRFFRQALMLLAIALTSLGTASTATAQEKHKHDHPANGPHKGALAEWGDEEYHVEITFDHDKKQAVIYILDEKAKKAKPIDASEIIITVKAKPPVTLKLKATPEKDDPKGMCSRFIGTHDLFAKHKDFEGTVSGKVGNKPYSGDFKAKHSHDH